MFNVAKKKKTFAYGAHQVTIETGEVPARLAVPWW